MTNASSIAVSPPNPYKFKRPWQRKIARLIDGIGSLFLNSPARAVEWERIRKVSVLRLDHIGDVVLASPCLEAIKKNYPGIQLDFWVGPWAHEAAEMSKIPDRVKVFEAPWMVRPRRKHWSWNAIRTLGRLLKEEKYDMVIDLRGDFRHLWAMWLSKTPIRIGQILTGGSFFLTHPVKFDPQLHTVEQNLSLLSQTGLKFENRDFSLGFSLGEPVTREMENIRQKMGLSKKTIVIHPACEVPSRRWMDERWAELINQLDDRFDVVLLGGKNDQGFLEKIQGQCRRKVLLAAGTFGLPALAAFLKSCILFIGVNSGPGHIAAAAGAPVLSLFSGTEPPSRWRPYGPNVTVIHKKTECWPCDRSICPFENDCMRMITVDEVFKKTQSILSLGTSSSGR